MSKKKRKSKSTTYSINLSPDRLFERLKPKRLSKKKTVDKAIVPSIYLAPYRLLGNRLDGFLPYFENLRDNIMRANLKISFPNYVSYILFFPGIAFIVIFVTTFILAFIIGASITFSLLLSIAFSFLSGASIFLLLYLYPGNTASSRKRNLESELPYLTSHMAVLSQGGMTPERIFNSISTLESERTPSVAAQEAKNIIRDVQFLGIDIISAMQKCAKRSPSKKFADLINGFVAVTTTGGDMTKYFLSTAKGMMDSARISAKQMVETLATVAELYVAIMVAFPILVIIMLSVMGIIGGSLGGMGIMAAMYLITYIVVPISALLMMVLLDMFLSAG